MNREPTPDHIMEKMIEAIPSIMQDRPERIYYKQTSLMGSDTVGFRNSDDEPWIKYRTDQHGAVLSFDANGHYPRPEWELIS